MDISFLKIIITVALAVTGWLIGHHFTTRRDVSNKRREFVIGHLIEAYQIIANDISQRPQTSETNLKLENILTNIQLFGSLEQITLAKELSDKVAHGGVFMLNPLINSLRDDLRKELNLPRIDSDIKWLRFNGPIV